MLGADVGGWSTATVSIRAVFGVERLQVVDTLADADGADGQPEALGNGRKNAASRRAVKLGDDEARHARDFLEGLDLRQRVLPRRSVEHEYHAVRRAFFELLQDADDLGELRH